VVLRVVLGQDPAVEQVVGEIGRVETEAGYGIAWCYYARAVEVVVDDIRASGNP